MIKMNSITFPDVVACTLIPLGIIFLVFTVYTVVAVAIDNRRYAKWRDKMIEVERIVEDKL
jgi:hypothetical protein